MGSVQIKIETILGKKFGRLTVEGAAEPSISGKSQALFRCACGDLVVKQVSRVLSGHVQSCGCLKTNPENISEKMLGRRFGRLVVQAAAPVRINRRTGKPTKVSSWVCLCDCGKVKSATFGSLISNSTKSCGCLKADGAAERLSHLLKGKRACNWKGFGDISGSFWNQICDGAKARELEVTVSLQDLWDLFQKQEKRCALSGVLLHFDSIGVRFDGNASLDRINSTKGYVPGNIQWVDKHIQQMKWTSTQEYFIELCREVVRYKGQILSYT